MFEGSANRVGWLYDLGPYPQPAGYRLTHRVLPDAGLQGLQRHSSEVRTAWEFTSEQPNDEEQPAGFYNCLGDTTDAGGVPVRAPCRVERLLLLRYDLSRALALDNTARARDSIRFDVRVHQQDGAPRSRLRGFDLDVSFDSGERWERPERVRARGDGVYEVTIEHPRLSRTIGTVSLRAEAWDDTGNRVEQTVLDAYGLRDERDDDDSDDDD
jgi:hypothetical protein